MAISDIGLGSSPNDGTGSTLRAGGAIVNSILDMWNTVAAGISYAAGFVGIGTATPGADLHVNSTGGSTSIKVTSDPTYDPFFITQITGVKSWSLGIDASDVNKFKITSQEGLSANVTLVILTDGGVQMPLLKSGATQVAAGAAATEVWKTASHATLPDNVLMIGV